VATIEEILWQKARLYASRHRITLGDRLGFGIHGIVFSAKREAESAKTAVKIHRDRDPYRREREIYERLADLSVSEICGFHAPELIACDEDLWIIEMTVVSRPFVLDFAGAHLESLPDFAESIWEAWEEEKRDQFGERWTVVRKILDALETHGVFMVDVSPSNIAFLEESGA
jgi:hypothetical protein